MLCSGSLFATRAWPKLFGPEPPKQCWIPGTINSRTNPRESSDPFSRRHLRSSRSCCGLRSPRHSSRDTESTYPRAWKRLRFGLVAFRIRAILSRRFCVAVYVKGVVIPSRIVEHHVLEELRREGEHQAPLWSRSHNPKLPAADSAYPPGAYPGKQRLPAPEFPVSSSTHRSR
jgi:hypothetical protein